MDEPRSGEPHATTSQTSMQAPGQDDSQAIAGSERAPQPAWLEEEDSGFVLGYN